MRSGLLSKQIKQAIMGPPARCHLNGILPVGPYWAKNVAGWVLTLLVVFIILENIQKQKSDQGYRLTFFRQEQAGPLK